MEEEEDRCASLGDNVDGDGKVVILAVGVVYYNVMLTLVLIGVTAST